MKNNESKYFYTAELMNQALLSLLEKKDFEFITVTEITRKAGVNRSTFYLHYDSVDELLEETIENINKQFTDSFKIKPPTNITCKEDAFLLTDDLLTSYLTFVKCNKRIFKLIHQKPHLFHTKQTYQKMYDEIFYPAISQFLTQETEKIYNLAFFTGGVSALVHKWLDLDCKTDIHELIFIIKNCIGFTAK